MTINLTRDETMILLIVLCHVNKAYGNLGNDAFQKSMKLQKKLAKALDFNQDDIAEIRSRV